MMSLYIVQSEIKMNPSHQQNYNTSKTEKKFSKPS